MDKSSLIDFNNDICYKVSSPLIPAPRSVALRLSDVANNPFDAVVRTIANKDDPFECNSDILSNNNFKNNITDNENKENIGHLISPIKTPIKAKKYKRLSASPLHISKNCTEDTKEISEIHNCSLDCNITDTSLQILSDSILNTGDDFSINAFNLPLPDSHEHNIYDSIINSLKKLPMIIQDESKSLIDSYSTCSLLNNAYGDSLSLQRLESKLSTRSSTDSKESFNPNSFNAESLGTSDISNVLASVSSVNSKNSETDNHFNKAFIKENSEIKSCEARRCLSARKPSNHFNYIVGTLKSENLNNSFAGYNYNDRNIKLGKFRFPDYDDDSVFFEATQLAEVFRTSAPPIDVSAPLTNEDISECSPPWEVEEIVFVDDDDGISKPIENNGKIESMQMAPDTNITSNDEIAVLQLESSNKAGDTNKCNDNAQKSKDKKDVNNYYIAKNSEEQENATLVQSNVTSTTDNNEVKNAKDLLHNLTVILNNNVTSVDDRKLGESLLNSLALALNVENHVVRNSTEDSKPINKLQRSKSDSKVGLKNRIPLTTQENKLTVPKIIIHPATPVKQDKNLKVRNEKEKVTDSKPINKLQRSKSDSKVGLKSRIPLTTQENKLTVPKIKTQPAAPVKHDKNLKVRNEKVTIKAKGVKAIIPLTNMAKNKKSIVPTPPKQFVNSPFQIKKTSTPNEPKIKPPIAQSTPYVSKKQETDINNTTPISKGHFGFSISPISRPASTSDISNTCLNHSLSPKNTSGSAPNLNKSGSKQSSNSSIPTIKYLNRRNSVSDMSTSRSSALNRSYDNNKPIRPPVQLKRSSSFQSKSVTATATQKTTNFGNNNTVKKYGIPGVMKSLKLVSKAKKTATD